MSFFKKIKNMFGSDKKEVDFLASTFESKTKNLTKEEVKDAIASEGYSNRIANKVVNRFKDNSFKEDTKAANIKDTTKTKADKDKILKELSQTIQTQNKEEKKEVKKAEEAKTDLTKKEKVKTPKEVMEKPKTKLQKQERANFFKRAYYNAEDKYYNFIESIGLTNLTDKIDKVIPSFIIFILLILLIIALLVYFLWPSPQVWSIGVHVIDSSGSDLSDVNVIAQYKDANILSTTTDVFGEAKLENLKARKTIIIHTLKSKYISKDTEFSLSKKNTNLEVTLEINTKELLLEGNSTEKTRTISFVENNSLLVVAPLSVTLSCSTPNKTPDPSYKNVTTGKVTVKQVAGCGDLKVSVASDNYLPISNMVVPVDDKINLTRVLSETGQLTVKLKNLSGNIIPDALIKVYASDSGATVIDESEFILKTGNSDIYGKYVFNLGPGNYLASVDKIGYLTLPKQGPYNVITNNNTNVEFTLLTPQDLINFDCASPIYEPFCINGQIDCNNPILLPYLTSLPNGSCILGTPGYIDVTIKDRNSQALVNADISLLGRLKDTNDTYETIATKDDRNHFKFDVLDTYNYRVLVSNTEINGYIQPDAVDTNGIDKNITILVDYSSSLNSGIVGVNVKENSNNVANSQVYLYRMDPTGDILVNPTPKITNPAGDVNFTLMRAGRNYYAFAVQSIDNLQGTSEDKRLDANRFLRLDVNLENIPRILNLKVSPNTFDINFFSPGTDEEITDFVVNQLSDGNKQFIFKTNTSQIYAILRSNGYASYQTEIIELFPGQEVYKTYNLTTIASCSKAKIEFVGLYDELGNVVVNNIDFNNNLITDEYKLKFRFTSCLPNKELAYAHIRSGTKKIVNDDSLVLLGTYYTAQDVDEDDGYAFQGELNDWNSTYYNQNYAPDHTYSWGGVGEKWIDIDFSDSNVDEIEFSVNFKFKGDISQLNDYLISYRALSFDNTNSYLYPTFNNYNTWSIVPEGYFYATTIKYLIPFSNTDYILNWSLTDSNNITLPKSGDDYVLDIDNNYKYNLKFLQLKDQNKNGSVLEDSVYTRNNLLFNSYIFKDNKPQTITGSQLNDINIIINDVNSRRGYTFDLNSIFNPIGFFETGASVTPKLKTNILNNFAKLEFPVLSYYSDSNYITNIVTSDLNGYNNIYYGLNELDFYVTSSYGEPLPGVIIKYNYTSAPNTEYELGTTGSSGSLLDANINVPLIFMGSRINFIFVFDSNAGFNNSQIIVEKRILSGYSVLPNSLDFNAEVVSVNGINSVFPPTNINDYNIVKVSGTFANLQTIEINSSSELIDVSSTNYSIEQANNLPDKLITEPYTTIIAPIILSADATFASQVIESAFYNFILIGYENTVPIIQRIDTIANIAVDYKGNVNVNPIINQEGVYADDDNLTHLELIKGVIEDLNLNYNISGLSATNSNLKINHIVASGDSSNIDLDYINSYLESNYAGDVIETNGLTVMVPFKLNSNSVIGTGYVVNLDFNFGFGDNYSMVHQTTTTIDVYDKTNILIGNLFGAAGNLINCTASSCNKVMNYKLTNKLKSYNISINDNSAYYNESDISLGIHMPLFTGSKDVNKSVLLNLDVYSQYDTFASYNYYYSNPNNNMLLNFKYTIKGITKDLNQSLVISIIVTPENPLPPQLGIKDNVCIGSGTQRLGNNVFIFASCEQENDTCESGADSVPKVRYCWGGTGFCENDISWSGEGQGESCISASSGYDITNKFYCDSSQMLLSVLTKLASDPTTGTLNQNYYIYLMSDGTSPDLVSDFMETINYFGVSGLDPNFIVDVKSIAQNNNFTITKTDQYVPGLYNVNVSYTLGDSVSITLTKEQDLPTTDRSLFYYLPVDSKLGAIDGTRTGYGATINYTTGQPSIKVYAGANAINNIDLNNFNSSNSLLVVNANNYSYTNINSPYFENLQSTDGKLMDLSLENTSSGVGLNIIYSLSRPVPVYSRVGCLNNAFRYVLKSSNDESIVLVLFTPFITWDYNINNTIDQAYDQEILATNGYKYHELYLSNYVTIPADINYSVLKTMIYLPVGEDGKLNPESYKLSLTGLGNSDNTKLYNINADGNEIYLKTNMGVNNVNLVSIQDLFTQIKNGNACIFTGATSTYIKWTQSKIDINATVHNRITDIFNNANTYVDVCATGEGNIE